MRRIAPYTLAGLAVLVLAASHQIGVQAVPEPGREIARFPPGLNEISGLALSRAHPNVIWVHNDSGDQPRVYAVSRAGALLGTYLLDGAAAVDWEDMAMGPAPGGGSYLYMADIGDNAGRRESLRVYRVPEPHVDEKQAAVMETIGGVAVFELVYEDGARDAEGFMVDPLTGDFYIVTKREPEGNRLYRVAAPAPGRHTLRFTGTKFRFTGATGADISPDGLQVLIRRYSRSAADAAIAASYWRRADASVSLVDLLKQPGQVLPLNMELQGEAIAFSPDNRGFYTTTERGSTPAAPLVFYGMK